MKAKKKLVIANWKMNPDTVGDAKKLFIDIRASAKKHKNAAVSIAAPHPYLAELRKLMSGKVMTLAAQDVSYEKGGAFTGEVSAAMLKSLDVEQVIVGHSERRKRGETDEEVNKKILALSKVGIIAVVCVGEHERDHHGKYLGHVEQQIKTALKGVTRQKMSGVVIAYEPVWAISTNKGAAPATPNDAHEMILYVRKVLTHLYGRKVALETKVLYGGSVNTRNVSELLEGAEADGFLVGGASLKAKDFDYIIKETHERGA